MSTCKSLAIGDFNGDLKDDLVVGMDGPQPVGVFRGNGDGSFGSISLLAGVAGGGLVRIADLDSDGHPDVVSDTLVLGPEETINVFLGNVGGTFQSPATFYAKRGIRALGTADANLDGRIDLVLTGANGTEIAFGGGDGTFSGRQLLATPSRAQGSAFGDLDGDGITDIVTANNADGNVAVLLNRTK
jgi:hypothetical protein